MALGTKLRFEIFKRDGFTCVYCGRQPPEVILEVDHLVAQANGGSDEEVNLVTSCQECNRGKSDRPLDYVPRVNLPSIEEQRERLEQLRAMADLAAQRRQWEEEQFYVVSDFWMKSSGQDCEQWELTGRPAVAVRRFIKLLPVEEVLDAIQVTLDRKRYINVSYFCGVCWRKIERRKAKHELDSTEQRSDQEQSLGGGGLGDQNLSDDAGG